MPIEIVKNDPASVQIASFIEQAGQFWELVNLIRITRKRRGGAPGFEQAGVVRHISKDGVVLDESKTAIEQFVAIGKADAEANGAADYKISLWGQREQAKRGRGKVVAEDSELLALTIRLGDEDPADGNEASLMREVGSLLPKQASGFAAALAAAESALTIQTRVIEFQGKMIEQTYEARNSAATQQNEAMRMLLEERKDVRKERREDDREEREAEREAAMEESRQANLQMFMGILMFGMQIAAMKFAHDTGQTPPSPPGAPPPKPGSLAPELGAIIDSLSAEEATQVQGIVGDRIWDLLKAAAKAPTDDECKAILHGLKVELKNHPNGKMALMQLAAVIGQDRMQRLVSILTAAGLTS